MTSRTRSYSSCSMECLNDSIIIVVASMQWLQSNAIESCSYHKMWYTRPQVYTLLDKTLSEKIFRRTKSSSLLPKFRHFCPTNICRVFPIAKIWVIYLEGRIFAGAYIIAFLECAI